MLDSYESNFVSRRYFCDLVICKPLLKCKNTDSEQQLLIKVGQGISQNHNLHKDLKMVVFSSDLNKDHLNLYLIKGQKPLPGHI